LRARAEIDKTTQDQIDIDQSGDRRTESLVLVANMVDLGLIFTLLAVYFLEWRVKDGIETALNRSVEDLRASNLRLQEGIMARARKLKVAAHDIKSPLAALKGYSEIACETTRSDQPIARLLQRMDSLTNSTLEMVNSLFAENGEVLPPSIVNIDNVLAEVCSASTSLARQKKQYIEYSGHGKSSLIEGNRNELLRCFYNLIDNAIKYSPVGAKIKVQWRADAERVRVTIIDQGPGFNTQDFVEMFSPGKTLSARPTAGESSSGYGLYSTKKIIEDHHGSIDIHNLDGRGAAIEIELPRQAGKFNRAFSEA
ncbi:MAG: sensor histidine kinase, partial [Bdellovibrionales bacterium]